ncbi:MAG: hypothetical protein JXR96_03240 [Deltaproteobacteria bacterium]|nr:hypothetical protein [Deltaproteobacteria bacterium]
MRACGVILLCLACACSSEQVALPDVLVETAHFRYFYEAGDEPCQKVLDRLENHYERISDYLGADLLGRQKIEYYKFRDRDTCLAYCGYPNGCWKGMSIYTSWDYFQEGLLVTYLACLGSPPGFFRAGAANYLSYIRTLPWIEIHAGISLRDMITDEAFARTPLWLDDVYRDDVAGSFSRFMVDHHGVDAFRALYASLASDMSFEEIDSIFREVMGEPLDSAVSEWQQELPVNVYAHHLCLLECGGEDFIELQGGAPEIVSGDLECTYEVIRIRLQAGDLEISRIEPSSLDLWPCSPTGGEVYALGLQPEGTQWVKTPPGEYFLGIEPGFGEDYPSHFELGLASRSHILAELAEQADVQLVSPPARISILANSAELEDDHASPLCPTAVDVAARFELDAPGLLSAHSSYDRACVLLCPDDGPQEACVLVSEDGAMRGLHELDAGVVYRLIIEVPEVTYHVVVVSLDI